MVPARRAGGWTLKPGGETDAACPSVPSPSLLAGGGAEESSTRRRGRGWRGSRWIAASVLWRACWQGRSGASAPSVSGLRPTAFGLRPSAGATSPALRAGEGTRAAVRSVRAPGQRRAARTALSVSGLRPEPPPPPLRISSGGGSWMRKVGQTRLASMCPPPARWGRCRGVFDEAEGAVSARLARGVLVAAFGGGWLPGTLAARPMG